MSRFAFHPAEGPRGLTSVDSAGGTRSLDSDQHRVPTRQIVIDSMHFDKSYTPDGKQLQAVFEPLKMVSGVRLVSCVVPRYFGPLAHAVLTATMENGDRYYLHAFAPQSSSLAHIGSTFRTSLEEDSKRAATSSFSSPWFQALTIKTTDIGFTVLEYYTSASDNENVKSVELDVTQFDGLGDTVKIDYGRGLVSNFWDDDGGDASFTNGLWHFSQRSSSVHSKYGCPYLCIQDLGNVEFSAQGRGNAIAAPECTMTDPVAADASVSTKGAATSVNVDCGVIRAVTVMHPGSGYPANATLDVSISNAFQNGSGAQAKAETDASGCVTLCYILDGGSGYLQAGTSATVVPDDSTQFMGTDAVLSVTVSRHGVRSIIVTDGGSNYAHAPSAYVSGVRMNAEQPSFTALTLDASGGGVLQMNNQDVFATAQLRVALSGGSVSAVHILDAGEGYRNAARPSDVFCALNEDGGIDPILGAYQSTKWFKTPLASLSKLNISVRCSDGTPYPLQGGRSVFVFDVYCSNA